MASSYNPSTNYAASSTGGTTTTLPGTTASTATQGASTASSSLSSQQVAAFLQEFDIDSTDEPAFINGNQLTPAGQALQDYGQTTGSDLLKAQQTLVAMGMLSPTDATGESNTTATSAFKMMTSTPNALSSYASALNDPTTPISAQLNEQIASGEKDVDTPITVDVTPSATLTQAITQAFNQNVGVTPTAQEINDFISQVQGQESGAQEAPRQQAQAEVTTAQNEQAALKALGTDGIDTFLSAYQSAVGATSTTGTATGTNPVGQTVGPAGPSSPATTTTTQVPNTYGAAGAIAHNLEPQAQVGISSLLNAATFGAVRPTGGAQPGEPSGGTHGVTTTTPGTSTAPSTAPLPPGSPSTVATYGGLYALNPTEWKAAQTALGTSTALGKAAAAATSAGGASKSVQQAAATALAQSLYNQFGSWSDVAVSMSGGDPTKVSGDASGTKTPRQTFAESVANQVNTQITNLQNQVNNQVITTKTTDPTSTDIDAEAAQAAKESDPVGYYAANDANWGSFLTKALYGTPLAEMQPTTSFAGPVGSAAQTAEAGSTTLTAAAPATVAA